MRDDDLDLEPDELGEDLSSTLSALLRPTENTRSRYYPIHLISLKIIREKGRTREIACRLPSSLRPDAAAAKHLLGALVSMRLSEL
jgi:hypothetical protein